MDIAAIIFIPFISCMLDVGMQVKHKKYPTVIRYSMFLSKTSSAKWFLILSSSDL